MTPNKRRKNKTRARMEATGTNYVRASRETGSNALKDPARLTWTPGTIAGAERPVKIIDSFVGSALPHLLVTGMSASRPEEVLIDMIDQLITANTPEDAQFRIIEPAMALDHHKDSPRVKHYVDSWTPDRNFWLNAAGDMEAAVVEMDRRNRTFINHPQSPKNLHKAREIAIRESNKTGIPLDQHPLWMPFIFIVIHECGAIFANPTQKDERNDQARFTVATTEIARKSRSAGIYLACSAEMSGAVPDVIGDQMRKIVLSTTDEEASMALVGDESLVGLPKTKGFIVDAREGTKQEFDRNPFK